MMDTMSKLIWYEPFDYKSNAISSDNYTLSCNKFQHTTHQGSILAIIWSLYLAQAKGLEPLQAILEIAMLPLHQTRI